MFNRFMNWFVPKLESWCERTGRMRIIYNNHPNEDDVYLIRYFLFYSKWFSIYIHRFMMSDLSVPHDHPFSFVGYIVKGQYEEETLHLRNDVKGTMKNSDIVYLEGAPLAGMTTSRKYRKQGSWAYRPTYYSHVVRIDRQYKLEEKHKAPLTIIFRGPYKKNWGFWEDRGDGYKSWTYHKTYLGDSYVKQEQPQDSEIEMRA